MKGPVKPEVVVILEDDYKQNWVYRPWTEIDRNPTKNTNHSASVNTSTTTDQASATAR